MRAIRSAHRRGAAIAGSSAGLHVQTDPMISGGESFEALRFGVARRFDERGVRVSRGLGTFGEGIADSHFDARGRIGRLLRAGLARGERWALGIEEDTALVVDGRDARVVGSGGVTVLDLADASGGRRARFAVAGVGLDYLLAGDRIDLRTGLVSPSTERDTEVPPSGLTPGAPLIEHVLRPYGSRDLIQELGTRGLESVSGAAARRRAGFEIEVARLPGTVVLVDEDGGPATVAGAAMRVEPIG